MTSRNITRRTILKLPVAAAGALHSLRATTQYSMPGLYPGRVVGVTHSGASVGMTYQTAPIQNMIRQGMQALTDSPDYITAWRKLFQPGDVVAIKVNPNGSPPVIASQACLMEILNGLLLAGVAPINIVVCERYQDILARVTGWLPSWVRTAYASPGSYLDDQTGIQGYDPDYYVDLPQYLLPGQDPTIPSDTRSHPALFVTGQVTKIVSLAVLKDHQASGVTLNLKNLSGGLFNNWNRFHPDVNTNYLLYGIPALVSLPVVRNKVTLGIIDGVHGCYDGGPMGWSCVWEHNTMYLATDVVAADRVGWLAIDAERANRGLPPEQIAPPDGNDTWVQRQPQHITAAGQMGLGEWRDDKIDFRQVDALRPRPLSVHRGAGEI